MDLHNREIVTHIIINENVETESDLIVQLKQTLIKDNTSYTILAK